MEDQASDLNSMLNDAPAPEPVEVPVAPEPQGEPQPAEPPAAKQAEPDHVPRAALVDERRKRQELEQRLAAFQAQQREVPQEQPKSISREQFETDRDYLVALAEERAAKVFDERLKRITEEQRAAQVQKQTTEDLNELLGAGRSKYQDFDDVVFNPFVPISESMITALMVLDNGHEVGYHIAKNPDEAARIFQLPPSSQAKELRKIAKELTTPQTPAPTQAPVALPTNLTQTRSTDGRFTGKQAWDGPKPLTAILNNRS